MTANKTYKQKIGDGVFGTMKVVGVGVVFVFCLAVGWIAWGGKKLLSGVEYAAEQGQNWSAGKATENAYQAGSDFKEAYNLYQQPAEQNANLPSNNEEEVELQPVDNCLGLKVNDEGYQSDSESLTI